jgi:acetyl esterase/lipase
VAYAESPEEARVTRLDMRVRLVGRLVRRQSSVATHSEAEIIAMRQQTPDNAVTRWLLGTVARGTDVIDRFLPGPAGDIPVRIYRPAAGGPGALPLIMYCHGGGFVLGDLRMGDWLCSSVAVRVKAVVVSMGYRLAPEHPFPAAVEDSYAALCWAAANTAELGVGGPLAVMGESAGGNLSAALCLRARERGGPAISHQTLLYPATDLTAPTPAAAVKHDPPFLSVAEMAAYYRMYLGTAGDPANPLASPLLAADHTALPAALIVVAEQDLLRDQGLRYAAALRDAGVPVRTIDYPGMPHGFLNFPNLCRAAPRAIAEICAEQAAALTG